MFNFFSCARLRSSVNKHNTKADMRLILNMYIAPIRLVLKCMEHNPNHFFHKFKISIFFINSRFKYSIFVFFLINIPKKQIIPLKDIVIIMRKSMRNLEDIPSYTPNTYKTFALEIRLDMFGW